MRWFQDYSKGIATLEKTREVCVTAGWRGGVDCVLLKVERGDGEYEYAYLSREQAKEISAALLKIAGLPIFEGEGQEALADGWKRLGNVMKYERFMVDPEDAAEFRVEQHADDFVFASMKHGETWTGSHRFNVNAKVYIIGGAR